MAVARWLETDSLSNQNISSALAIGAYTADTDRMIVCDVSLDQVAGGGDYVIYITRQINGAGSAYVLLPKTTCAAASGETAIAMQSGPVTVRSGDVLTVYVDGLAGDTTTPDTVVRWFEMATLRPDVADRQVTVAATGEASANVTMQNGVAVAPADANGNVPVVLYGTQPAVTFGQVKIAANVSGQGALDVRNSNANGHGLYADGGNFGLRTQGGNGGQGNFGTYYGQVNSGATGAYNYGSTADVDGVDEAGIRAALGMAAADLDTQLAAIGIDGQDVADALLLAPSGVAAAGSAMDYLADISAASAAGSGAVSFPVTINDEDSNPIDGVEVWISTDSAGASVVAGTLSTDALGLATFMLDAGTYYLWRQKSGYNFTNPVTIVVS